MGWIECYAAMSVSRPPGTAPPCGGGGSASCELQILAVMCRTRKMLMDNCQAVFAQYGVD